VTTTADFMLAPWKWLWNWLNTRHANDTYVCTRCSIRRATVPTNNPQRCRGCDELPAVYSDHPDYRADGA
jgi:hypothetical protein